MENLFAHSLFGHPTSRWELLHAHLNNVQELSEQFANKFNSSAFASLAAKFHDIGKASNQFQDFLNKAQSNPSLKGPDHSTAGAKFLANDYTGIGHLLAYAIAGHHAGMPDGLSADESSLENRIKRKQIPEWRNNAEDDLGKEFFEKEDLKPHIIKIKELLNSGFSMSMWTRMIFSALVDADFLATENFMSKERATTRTSVKLPSIDELQNRFETYIEKFCSNGKNNSSINQIREEIRIDCLAAAEQSPGLFTLTVPTGGGKTLSSLAFALNHAKKFGLTRIIYVIPFTSIIEQNAGVFKTALGDDAVLEHHSSFDYESNDKASQLTKQQKLATENWDSPIIVTTNVQFYESLFSNKPSKCRKLHNLTNSVIIIDEAQSLPINKLKPCLQAIDELVKNYNSTIVLCTATQPAINKTEDFPTGLQGNEYGVREIISPNRNLQNRLKRVNIKRIKETLSEEKLAEKLGEERQVLCILNTRATAKKVFEKLTEKCPNDEELNFHLSAQMCAAHRIEVFEKIRARLAKNEPCRVISTQLIEAGVDIDFPCVYRVMGGIDSIAQAAGRCNREGKIGKAGGRVFIFELEQNSTLGFLRQSADIGKEVLDLEEFGTNPLSSQSIKKYFELLYWSQGEEELDKLNVLSELIPKKRPQSEDEFMMFKFRTLGEKFRLIDDATESVIIPYGEKGEALREQLKQEYDPLLQRQILRQLQRYTVSVYKPQFEFAKNSLIEMVHDKYPVLISTTTNYSEKFGLNLNEKDSTEFLNY